MPRLRVISRLKRTRLSTSLESCLRRRTFMATGSPSSVSSALKTTPIPPAPRFSCQAYRGAASKNSRRTTSSCSVLFTWPILLPVPCPQRDTDLDDDALRPFHAGTGKACRTPLGCNPRESARQRIQTGSAAHVRAEHRPALRREGPGRHGPPLRPDRERRRLRPGRGDAGTGTGQDAAAEARTGRAPPPPPSPGNRSRRGGRLKMVRGLPGGGA